MEGILEVLRGLVAGHERQLLIAGELALLGTLLITLVYQLRKRRSGTRVKPQAKPARSLPRKDVETLYRQEESWASGAPFPAEAATELSEIFPPELSRRIDILEKKMRGLALRSRS